MIIKVCGMRDVTNIKKVTALGVDWIGLIFWPKSPRYIPMEPVRAGIIPDQTMMEKTTDERTSYKRVGVFVDQNPQDIITRAVSFKLDLIQLHGHESPTLIRNLHKTLDPDLRNGIKFIKAISVKTAEDIATYKQYQDCVDYFLFDTKCPSVGGCGQQFDWNVLQAYDGQRPFLLSGGIGPDDVQKIKSFRHPQFVGIDLNSRFEQAPALKDIPKLQLFLSKLNN